MAVSNPFEITYDNRSVGGGSDVYQLVGPYVIDKSYDAIRLVFDVIVVASTLSGLQSSSEALEDDFRKRLDNGDRLVINIGGNRWTYTNGSTILKTRASIAKTGNPDTDRGYSRAYTVTIEGELPADDADDAGLRDVEVLVDFEASRQKLVTLRGTFTATSAGDAKERYEARGDAVASDYLDAIDSEATFELVDETFTMDREGGSSPAPHLLTFTRQYVELLEDQTQGTLDDPQIRDHRITFSDAHTFPGDSDETASRLRRVLSNYECAVDVDETTEIETVYRDKVREHIRALFVQNFDPAEFALEEERVSLDRTTNRVSASMQFIYRGNSGEDLIEIAQSVAYRETRTIQYTPTHEPDEFSYEADVGFATLERVWTRTAMALGSQPPLKRIQERANSGGGGAGAAGGGAGGAGGAGGGGGSIGPFDAELFGEQGPDSKDTTQVNREGWNVIASTSQAEQRFLGDPDEDNRITVTLLSETVVERWHKKPGGRTGTPIPGGGGQS